MIIQKIKHNKCPESGGPFRDFRITIDSSRLEQNRKSY